MTVLEKNFGKSTHGAGPSRPPGATGGEPIINVGSGERGASVVAGSILAVLGLSRASLPGLLIAGVGGALIYRGASGHCHLYQALGTNTAEPDANETDAEESVAKRGIHIEEALLVNRSRDELYSFWRNFENLPQIMSYLERVEVKDEKTSHWVARAPKIAGGRVSWDAEITRDEPGTLIAWRSLPGSHVDTVGQVRFAKAMGDRGTEVHVTLEYVPPAGQLGHFVAKLFGLSPERQIREDLRIFKRMMELGELPTVDGQTHGSCAGPGQLRAD